MRKVVQIIRRKRSLTERVDRDFLRARSPTGKPFRGGSSRATQHPFPTPFGNNESENESSMDLAGKK